MIILIWATILILSLFILSQSSKNFVNSAENFGKSLKLSPLIIGITILAIGTSLPELITSIISVINNSSEIVIGNVIGSNIANILFIVGISAIVTKKIIISQDSTKKNFIILLITTILLFLSIIDQKITLIESLIFLLLLGFYIYYLTKSEKKNKEEKNKVNPKEILILIISGALIFFSAKYTVESIIQISSFLNIGKEIIAATIVAFGTSLPELAVCISTLKRKNKDLLIGTIIGSNIFNILAIIGISGLFGTIIIPTKIFFIGTLFLTLSLIFYFFAIKDQKITRIEGIILLLLYLIFILTLIGLF